MRILLGAIAVSAVCQRCGELRGCARRSLAVFCRDINSSPLSAISVQLDRAVQTIAEVAEPGDDEFVRVELAIDDGRVDLDVGMMLLDERHALRRGDDAGHADRLRAGARE